MSGPVGASTGGAELSNLEVDVEEVPILDNVSPVIEAREKESLSDLLPQKKDNESESVLNVPDDDAQTQAIFEIENDNNNINLKDIPDNHTFSDHLLAKALSDLDKENIYEKPRGKSYRQARKVNDIDDVINTSVFGNDIDVSRLSEISRSPPLSPSSTASISRSPPLSPSSTSSFSNDTESVANPEIIEFINEKKDFILTLVSD